MKKVFKTPLILITGLIFQICCFQSTAQTNPKETGMDEMWGSRKVVNRSNQTDKTKFFDQSNYGMFVHWGLFSSLGGKWKDKTYYGIGEWMMNDNMANIPVEEYKLLAKNFNPKGFDAKKLVQIAKDAGMKYIIITSKHHEGFAMFKSKADPFNIVDATPFARDPMKELSKACRDAGLGFGFYYSHNQDWTAPGGNRGPSTDENGKPVTFDDYFYKKCLPQVKEICSNYGAIDFVWFDTPGEMKKELVVELAKTVRTLQPKAMICSRIGHGLGDYASEGDMEVPRENIDGLWETCDTNNDSWSYAWYDNNFKSPREILRRLVATVGRGGSYLFNVGPNGDGVVPEIGVEFLLEAGKWIKKYPQVIYDAGRSPWGHTLPWGDVTTQGNSLYLSVFDWPGNGKLYLPGLDSKILSAKLLGETSPAELKFTNENGWTIIDISYKQADPLVSVIELKLDVPVNNLKVATHIGIDPTVQTTLLADFASLKGITRKSVRWMEKFGEWKHAIQMNDWKPESAATWTVDVIEPGHYYLSLNYKGKGKLVWKTTTDEGIIVQNQQPATEKYNTYPMGILTFKKAGKHTLTVALVEGEPTSSSLESIVIKPIK